MPVKTVFKKNDRENEKKKDGNKDKSIYYYNKTLWNIAKKDVDKLPKFTLIGGKDDMKVRYNRLRGDMINKPEDKNNEVLIIKAPKNGSIDKLLQGFRLFEKLLNQKISKKKLYRNQ